MRPRAMTLLLLLHATLPALADEGRIPIHAPSVIAAPGVYVVTRDFTGNAPLTIQATDVTVDLGGHTLTCTGTHAISIGSGNLRVSIRNGTLVGGYGGITANGGGYVFVEAVNIRGALSHGIAVAAAKQVEVRGCRIESVGTAISTSFGIVRIIDNVVTEVGKGISVWNGARAVIRGNLVDNVGLGSTTAGIEADGPGLLIEDNVVHDGEPFATGIVLSASSTGAVIRGNVVSGFDTTGISGGGPRALVEGNQAEGNGGCGISIGNQGVGYRNNMSRNNAGGNLCGSGLDGGGNIF